MTLSQLAGIAVVIAGLFLLALGAVVWFRPDRARRFLLGMAQTPGRHGLELCVRTLAGAAFLAVGLQAPPILAFQVFGGVLVVTTLGMALIPWRRHRDFARRWVPEALKAMPWLGGVSGIAGLAILGAMVTRFGP